jgi:GNAT superfamily N-acetyltransferase
LDNTGVIEIKHVRGDSAEAVAIVRAMEDWVTENFGPTTPDRTSTVRPEEMVPPDGVFVLVVDGGRVVAGGGVRRLEPGVGEIKRMFVVPDARGQGHARRLLEGLEAAAVDLGYERLRLDTAQSMTTAMGLYRRAGYRDIPDYNGNSYASFWGEKAL